MEMSHFIKLVRLGKKLMLIFPVKNLKNIENCTLFPKKVTFLFLLLERLEELSFMMERMHIIKIQILSGLPMMRVLC